MINISGFGVNANVVASNTFPIGFDVTAFADDVNPIDIPDQQIAEAVTGLNGDLQTFSTPKPIELSLAVIPTSDDDINLSLIAESNRAGKGKISARDKITITIIYPSGKIGIYQQGALTNSMPGEAVTSSGRIQTKVFKFKFENWISG